MFFNIKTYIKFPNRLNVEYFVFSIFHNKFQINSVRIIFITNNRCFNYIFRFFFFNNYAFYW